MCSWQLVFNIVPTYFMKKKKYFLCVVHFGTDRQLLYGNTDIGGSLMYARQSSLTGDVSAGLIMVMNTSE